MTELEIKKIDLFSAFKTTIYLMIVPVILFVLIGIVSIVAGLFTKVTELFLLGMFYSIISILIVVINAVFAMLVALIYNWLSGKFEGLKITVSGKIFDNNLPLNNSQ